MLGDDLPALLLVQARQGGKQPGVVEVTLEEVKAVVVVHAALVVAGGDARAEADLL